MNTININDIVRFNKNATSRAAVFCRDHGITGKVVGEERGTLAVEVGFHYQIYVHVDQIDRVVNRKEIPEMVE